MRPALLSGAMFIPVEHVNLRTVKDQLTVSYLPMGAEEAVVVQAYTETRDYISVPRQYGISLCKSLGIPVEDKTSQGFSVSFSRINPPRPYQVNTLTELHAATNLYYDFIFRAHTGWGKTYGGLWLAAELGVTTLVIVDQDNLKEQWLEALDTHYGMTIENGEVGIIQGPICDYDGRAVVIAMVQTLTQKQFAKAVYSYFGFVICDEVHTLGAPTFSTVLRKFPATYRLGVSATPKRKDGTQKLLDYNLGKVRVAADKEHDESNVYFVEHRTVYSWYANISPKIGRIITEVAEDGSRNLLLAEVILWLYESGRDTIALSDRIEQLKHLKSMLYYMGVDEEIMGLYTGYDPVYKFAKDPTPPRRPAGWEKGTEYTPVSLQLISKNQRKTKLQGIKEKALIQLATYQKAGKGYDVARLAGGVDCTPRGTAEQIHGRILREYKGKRKAVWVTPMDSGSYRLMYTFANRVIEYAKSNGRMFEWTEDGELIEWNAKELAKAAKAESSRLKSMRIETNKDGSNTLRTQASEKTRKLQAAKDTVNKIRAGKR